MCAVACLLPMIYVECKQVQKMRIHEIFTAASRLFYEPPKSLTTRALWLLAPMDSALGGEGSYADWRRTSPCWLARIGHRLGRFATGNVRSQAQGDCVGSLRGPRRSEKNGFVSGGASGGNGTWLTACVRARRDKDKPSSPPCCSHTKTCLNMSTDAWALEQDLFWSLFRVCLRLFFGAGSWCYFSFVLIVFAFMSLFFCTFMNSFL